MRFVTCLLAMASTLHGCGKWRSRNDAQCACLAVGQAAPEIMGEGVDGVPFKLSDYKGKVVVLGFWGEW